MNKKLLTAVIISILIFSALAVGIKNYVIEQSSRKLEMTKGRIDSIYDYGLIQYMQNDLDRAIKAFEILDNPKISPEKREAALSKLADAYEKKGRYDLTLDYYRKIIHDFPNSKSTQKVKENFEKISMKLLFSPVITDGSIGYTVQPGDTLVEIANRYKTTAELLARSNNLDNNMIAPGQTIKVLTAKLSLLVDKSENKLYLIKDKETIKTYTVSTGANNCTPVGKFKVEEKMISPVWFKVGAVVSPDSSEYELGKYWMGLSVKGYGIHGTKDENTIGKQITKGCVRMMNNDVEELYSIIPSGTEVEIVD